jgi:hypothetical protein
MVLSSIRARTRPTGHYRADPPWTTVHLDDTACGILGLGSGPSQVPLAAAGLDSAPLQEQRSVQHTARTGTPLVLAYRHRRGEGDLRTLVTVAELHRDAHGAPARVDGLVVDITDELQSAGPFAEGGAPDLDRDTLAAVVDVGAALVVVLCGEFDMSTRDHLHAAMDATARVGCGPVFVDLARLRFCEAHSLRALVDTAQHLAGHRTVTILDPYPTLRRALRLMLARSGGPAIAIQPTR